MTHATVLTAMKSMGKSKQRKPESDAVTSGLGSPKEATVPLPVFTQVQPTTPTPESISTPGLTKFPGGAGASFVGRSKQLDADAKAASDFTAC